MHSVCNLKRKVAGLPFMTEQEFEVQECKSEEVTHRPRNNDDTMLRKPRTISYDNIKKDNIKKDNNPEAYAEGTADGHSEKVPSTQCLFCPFLTSTYTTALEHMSTHHGLFIPSLSALYSLDSLLSYLALIVFEYHECLYCGQEKATVEAVQTHMRDKGHCMIDMSELGDFWDLEADQENKDGQTDATVTRLPKMERRLPSMLISNSRHSRGDETTSKPIRRRHAHSRHLSNDAHQDYLLLPTHRQHSCYTLT